MQEVLPCIFRKNSKFNFLIFIFEKARMFCLYREN